MDDVILETAQTAAREAGQLLIRYFGRVKGVGKENQSQNLVTEADVASEACIVEILRKAFPEHQVLGEEGGGEVDLEADHLWIVDPLDGTNNYAHGIPQFGVSIAYAQRGQVVAGVVLDPLRNEMFHARRGKGAFLNGEPIQVSPNETLSKGIFGTGFYYDRGYLMEQTLESIKYLFYRNIQGIRRLGGATLDLCWVACGRFDGFFEYYLAPWDYAAGALIIEEAGGRCSDRDGKVLKLNSGHVIVSNPFVFNEFLEVVRWRPEGADVGK